MGVKSRLFVDSGGSLPLRGNDTIRNMPFGLSDPLYMSLIKGYKKGLNF